MELWFWAAVLSAVLGGISNFFFKVASVREYNAEIFTLYGGLTSVIGTGLIVLIYAVPIFQFNVFVLALFIGGVLSATNSILKVHALRHIDATIFFPLFKLLSPALAIIAGITFFNELFTIWEWLGMLLGLSVPLLLISKVEHSRQNNLTAGLLLVVIMAFIAAGMAAINKLAMDHSVSVLVGIFYGSLGVLIGTIVTMVYKKGFSRILSHIQEDTSSSLFFYASLRALFMTGAFALALFAFTNGGTLAIVQTIHSIYILIPIVLSIIFYNEHWNLQKAVAIVLSVASLALLG